MIIEKETNKKLGEILVSRGLITPEQLKEALSLQKKDNRLIGEILVSMKYVTEESIAWALTVQYGFPYLPLDGYQIDKDVIEVIPKEFAAGHGLIGIDKIGQVLTIAMSNPLDQGTIKEIEKMSHCSVQIFISTLREVHEAIDRCYHGGT